MLESYKPEIDQDLLNKYRSEHVKLDRLSWHEYFIIQAYIVSLRSQDSQTKFGTVIVDKDNHVVSTGYNSFVRNIDDENLSNVRPAKYDFMIHSEHNAILSASRRGLSLSGCKCYVTGRPCINCLQFMYQAGIEVVYFADVFKANMCSGDKNKFDLILSLMFDGIELIEIKSENLTNKINQLKEIFS